MPAQAHVSEGSFVLLLPTGAYISAGVATVVFTVLLLLVVPGSWVRRLFSHRRAATFEGPAVGTGLSLLSLLLMCFAIFVGLTGPRDPLSNLMSLGFWTLGWVALVSLAGFFGNLWVWVNPWSGLARVLGLRGTATFPSRFGMWPSTGLLLLFAAYLLADIAPDDPARLALRVAIYWAVIFALLWVFGAERLRQFELGHAIFDAYGRLAALRVRPVGGVGGPGWQVLRPDPVRGAGVFALTLLAVGSFDGLNETFWWLARIGVNPLEFPGRSAVVVQTLTGLGLSVAGLIAIFAGAVWIGLRLARGQVPFQIAFGWLALGILPIAFVYHVAHYLTSFLVAIQYTVAAISDPFATGLDWLGLEPFRVTTGFFNTITTVRLIWLTQAGLVVLGHVWSVLLTHRIALDLVKTERQATLLTLPLSLFMIAYTFLGLWLLAAPKGA